MAVKAMLKCSETRESVVLASIAIWQIVSHHMHLIVNYLSVLSEVEL